MVSRILYRSSILWKFYVLYVHDCLISFRWAAICDCFSDFVFWHENKSNIMQTSFIFSLVISKQGAHVIRNLRFSVDTQWLWFKFTVEVYNHLITNIIHVIRCSTSGIENNVLDLILSQETWYFIFEVLLVFLFALIVSLRFRNNF